MRCNVLKHALTDHDLPLDFISIPDIRHLQDLWNLAQPDQFAQNDLNQVQRYSLTNEGPAVAVGETVNSDPDAWVNNCSSKGGPCGGAANNLSRQVFAQYGQAGYAADASAYTAPTPGMQEGSGQSWYDASTTV